MKSPVINAAPSSTKSAETLPPLPAAEDDVSNIRDGLSGIIVESFIAQEYSAPSDAIKSSSVF